MELSLTKDAEFQTVGIASVVGASSGSVGSSDSLKLRYSVAEDTITVVDSNDNQIVFETPNVDTGHVFTDAAYYSNPTGTTNADANRRLTVQVPSVGGVSLSYARFGNFSRLDKVASGDVSLDHFVFGIPTADMPASGTATYEAEVRATAYDQSQSSIQIYDLNESTGTFSVDFGTGRISTSMHLLVSTAYPTRYLDFATFDGTGALVSGEPSFAGSFSGSATFPDAVGDFAGAFFGPEAKEMAYAFIMIPSSNFVVEGNMSGLKAN